LYDIEQLKKGYKIFAPDGYIRFYQGSIDLLKEFSNKILKKAEGKVDNVDEIWNALKEAIDTSLLEKKYVGITKKGVKLYQVPEEVADILSSYARATGSWTRLFLDKPVDAFRFLALALTPRWNINNIIGNTIFSVIAGDIFKPEGYLTAREAIKKGLVPDEVFSGFYRTEKLMTGKLGKTLEKKGVQALKETAEKIGNIPPVKAIKKIGDISYKVNSMVDDFYRASHYINKATKLAKAKLLKKTGTKLNNTIKLLEYAKRDPEIIEKAINSVNEFFYGVQALGPIERQYLRRLLPFYSWYKFIIKYAYTLPTNYPGRANIISNLARSFYYITGQDKLPDYLKGSVPIGETKTGDIYYLRTSGPNPFSLLQDLATRGIGETIGGLLTPPLKTAMERITGREAFLGRRFTAKDIIEDYGGRLYKFNPKTGKVEEVKGSVKPTILEHLLRNYVPQYQMLEDAIAAGRQRYTAAGLPSLITGEGYVVSPITGRPKTLPAGKEKVKLRALGLLGLPVYLRTRETQEMEREALRKATSRFFYEQFPFLSPQFKIKLKNEIENRILEKIRENLR